MIEDSAELLEDFKTTIMPKIQSMVGELKTDYPEDWQKERRTEYLKSRMEDIIFKTFYLMNDYELLKGDNVDSRLFVGAQIVGAIKTIQKLQGEIIGMRKREPGKNGVTEDEIRQARQYPWSQLVEVNRNGMAICPFHDDKDPSFSTKNNFGHCFGCQWSGDQIKFLMERDGLSFPDAVKRLQ
jgi:hypothetical protein